MTMYNPALGDADEFLRQHIKLIHHVAKRFWRSPYYDEAEFFSAGLYGLTKAYEGFDPARAGAFSTYAVPLIFAQMSRYIRTAKASKRIPAGHMASLDASYEIHSDGDEVSLLDTLPQTADFTGDTVRDFVSRLGERDQRLLALRMDGYTQMECASELGTSQVQISRWSAQIGRLWEQYKEGTLMPKPEAREAAIRLLNESDLKAPEIAEKVGLSIASVYNIRKELQKPKEDRTEPKPPVEVEMSVSTSKPPHKTVDERFNAILSTVGVLAQGLQQVAQELTELRRDVKADDETKRKIAEAQRILSEIAG